MTNEIIYDSWWQYKFADNSLTHWTAWPAMGRCALQTSRSSAMSQAAMLYLSAKSLFLATASTCSFFCTCGLVALIGCKERISAITSLWSQFVLAGASAPLYTLYDLNRVRSLAKMWSSSVVYRIKFKLALVMFTIHTHLQCPDYLTDSVHPYSNNDRARYRLRSATSTNYSVT